MYSNADSGMYYVQHNIEQDRLKQEEQKENKRKENNQEQYDRFRRDPAALAEQQELAREADSENQRKFLQNEIAQKIKQDKYNKNMQKFAEPLMRPNPRGRLAFQPQVQNYSEMPTGGVSEYGIGGLEGLGKPNGYDVAFDMNFYGGVKRTKKYNKSNKYKKSKRSKRSKKSKRRHK